MRLLHNIAMAAIGRLFSRSSWSILRNRCAAARATQATQHGVRFLNTSNESKDSISISEKNPEYLQEVEKFKDISKFEENWVSHGYNPYDAEEDLYWHHVTMFFSITVLLIGGSFILAYLPDQKLAHWRQREAYLELARREKLGLPLIDPNLVDPVKMKAFLPSDEELGNKKIII